MLSATDNAYLNSSEPDTPMGNYLRCHWHPVALSEEVAKPDCAPIRLKVMGEDLLLFRDSKGKTGLIEPFCAHRGADLFFGRNEECGFVASIMGGNTTSTVTVLICPTFPRMLPITAK